MSKMILILSCALLAATGVQAFAQGQVVTVEGVADAKGQPLLSAKRVAWMDAMRTLAEQVAGMDFVLIRESTEGLFFSRGKGKVDDDD